MNAKPTNTTRLYGQNVNGLSIDSLGGDITQICDTMLEAQIDIAGFTEHNLDTSKYHVINTCHTTIKTCFSTSPSKMVMASSQFKLEGNYKPGGTMLLSTGNILSRLIESGKDSMGRWVYQTYAGRNQDRITIINCYQVCAKHSNDTGTYSAHAQQESALRTRNVTDPNPRKHFRKDLTAFLKSYCKPLCHNSNHDIICMGDFNEELGSDLAGMTKISSELSLVDLMQEHHQHLEPVATYARGTKRIDYMLTTRHVSQCVDRCGYEPFNNRIFSDHRAYFVDFNSTKLFGGSVNNIPPSAFRDVNSKHLKSVTKYIRHKHDILTKTNFFERLITLSESRVPRPRDAEALDRELTRASKAAGKKCQRLRTPKWSLTLAKARTKVNILRRILSMGRTGIDLSDQIINLQQEVGDAFLIPATIEECKLSLRQAQTRVKELVRSHESLRRAEQDERIQQAQRGTTGKTSAQILRNIRKAEEIKAVFKKLKILKTGQFRGIGLNMIEVPAEEGTDPKQCTEWKTVNLPDEIIQRLMERNRSHFGQAHGTPFTVPPLSEQLQFEGNTESAEAIFTGDYDVSQLEDITGLVIQNLQQFTQAQIQGSPFITDAEFSDKIHHWPEKTTTSPSGIDLGHYHMLIARTEFDDTDTPEEAEIKKQQSDLRSAHLALLNYGIRHGHSFHRWRTVVNIMIEKDPGKPRIHRLRVIHIYEADYNLMLAVKWRNAIHKAEDEIIVNEGQYGSRPNRNATDPVFMEEMQYEICRASRKPQVNGKEDATACFDRIIPNCAVLASRAFGVPKQVTAVWAKTLKEAKFHLRTMLGITEEEYSHSEEYPIYGTGQGSGNSPVVWCFISSVLFDSYEEKAHGASYESPDREDTITMFMVGFVDDS
jgi:hypothetical protein